MPADLVHFFSFTLSLHFRRLRGAYALGDLPVTRLLSAVVFLSFALGSQLLAQTGRAAQPITVDGIFVDGGITGRGPETLEWSPDGSKLSFVQRDDSGEQGQLWYVDAATGEKKVLVSDVKLAQLAPPASKIRDEREKDRLLRYHVAAYSWAPDSKHLLFDAHGQLWYYSLDTGTAVQMTSSPDASEDPKFSPDGKKLAYVRGHNLYLHPMSGLSGERPLLHEGKHKKDEPQPAEGDILNGEVDWLYSEELNVRSNFFWSPEGGQILFLQMDESRVPSYPITDWMPMHAHVEQEKYPQPGDPNPAVRLGVVGGDGGKPTWIDLTDDDGVYVPRFGWIREEWAWAEVLNRKQDAMDLYFIDTKSGKSRRVLHEEEPEAWVNVNDDFRVLKSGDRFLWTSWRDGYTHIYTYSFDKNNPLAADAKLERQLESGEYEVLGINGVDEETGTVYFTANKDDPRQERLFAVKLDGSEMRQVSREPGRNSVSFAENAKHYVDTHSGTLSPTKVSFCRTSGECSTIWEGRSVADYDLIAPKDLTFKAEDGTVLYGYLILPPNAEPGEKIPVIDFIYGGPAGQTVTDAWGGSRLMFHEMLAKEGFAIFSVDNRGTPNRGRKFSAALRHQFGGVELKDQLAALEQLYAQYPQLDRTRTGIWGWSNGGSMTLYAMTHSTAFKAGIAVAGITNQRDYDSTYIERYMGLPKDNASGYDDSTVNAAGNLHGSVLIVHGTSDDNVHFQNSIQMTDALIRAGKQFREMFYPNKTHGIAGVPTQRQLYTMMREFWEKELK